MVGVKTVVAAGLVAALCADPASAYKKLTPGMSWANIAWETDASKEKIDGKDMVLVDGWDITTSKMADIRKRAPKAVIACYFSAGTWEQWRPDANKYKSSLKAKQYYSGSNRELWLILPKWKEWQSQMRARIDVAKSKKCDAVEFDNQDCYVWGSKCCTGYSSSQLRSAQVEYAKWLANLVHSKDMAVGLKNAMELMPQIGKYYDFAINEQCSQYKECHYYNDFIAQNKAVFGIEYTGKSGCSEAEKLQISRKYKTSSGNFQDCPATKADSGDVMDLSSLTRVDDLSDVNMDPSQEPEMSYAKQLQEYLKEAEQEAAVTGAAVEDTAVAADATDAVESSGSNTAVIIGSVVGVLAVAVLAGGGFFVYKKKQRAAIVSGGESTVAINA